LDNREEDKEQGKRRRKEWKGRRRRGREGRRRGYTSSTPFLHAEG
jgi:hypothetical protein